MTNKPLRVGIDARPLQNHHKYRGVGHFLYNSLEALSRLDNNNHYTLYLLNDSRDDLPPLAPGFDYKIKIVPPARLGARGILDNLRPRTSMTWASGIDIFFQPDISQGLPFNPPRRITVLYDLIPLIFKNRYFPPWHVSLSRRTYSANKKALITRLVYRQQLSLYKRSSKILAISEATRKDTINLLGIPKSLIDVVHLAGSEPTKAREVSPERLKIKKPYILYIGSIDYRKNVTALIKAFEKVRVSGLDIQLVLVGKDFTLEKSLSPEAELIRQLKASSQYDQDIIIMGYLEDAALTSLYKNARAFVFPSLYEGFGLPILEAMISGCPVIALSNSSIPEVAGDAAILLSSSKQLADGIIELLGDPDKSRTMIAKGYAQAKKFSWERTASDILTAIREVGEQ